MSLRQQVSEAVHAHRLEELDELVAREPRALRYLVGLSYRPDAEVRRTATRGVALAARYHPELVQNLIRRLVWAMNDESGTNAVTAPEVLRAIAGERPELLLPMVPDLTRLAADASLQEGLAATLRLVSAACPGQVGQKLGRSLNKRFRTRKTNGNADPDT